MRIILALLALVAGMTLAFAQQEVAVVVAEPTWWQGVIAAFVTPLQAILYATITAVTGAVGVQLTKYVGQAWSDRLTERFQAAAMNAAAWLISQLGMEAAKKLKSGDKTVLDAVQTQIITPNPDLIRKLNNPDKKVMGDKIISWVQKIAMGGLEGGGVLPGTQKK